MRGSLIKDCKTPTSRDTSSPYHSLRSAPLLFFGNFLKKEVLKMKRRKPAMGGSRTTTGAVVFPRSKPSLSLRFSPLVPVRPGKTTVPAG